MTSKYFFFQHRRRITQQDISAETGIQVIWRLAILIPLLAGTNTGSPLSGHIPPAVCPFGGSVTPLLSIGISPGRAAEEFRTVLKLDDSYGCYKAIPGSLLCAGLTALLPFQKLFLERQNRATSLEASFLRFFFKLCFLKSSPLGDGRLG